MFLYCRISFEISYLTARLCTVQNISIIMKDFLRAVERHCTEAKILLMPSKCKIDIINIDNQLIPSFWSHKISLLKICTYLSRFRGQLSSTALVINTIYVKYCSVLTQYYTIDPNIAITFSSKKKNYIFVLFLCNLMRPKTWDNNFSKNITKSIMFNFSNFLSFFWY